MVLLPMSHGVCTPPVTLFLIFRGKEIDITPNIAVHVHPLPPLVILFLTSRQKENDTTANIARVVHFPVIWFIIFRGVEGDITPHNEGGLHFQVIWFVTSRVGRGCYYSPYRGWCTLPCYMVHNIQGERLILLPISLGLYIPDDMAHNIQGGSE